MFSIGKARKRRLQLVAEQRSAAASRVVARKRAKDGAASYSDAGVRSASGAASRCADSHMLCDSQMKPRTFYTGLEGSPVSDDDESSDEDDMSIVSSSLSSSVASTAMLRAAPSVASTALLRAAPPPQQKGRKGKASRLEEAMSRCADMARRETGQNGRGGEEVRREMDMDRWRGGRTPHKELHPCGGGA